MTEADWLSSTDAQGMLAFLRNSGKLSERKARLFAVACARSVWSLMADPRSRQAVEVGEQYADGLVGQKALKAARRNAFAATKAPSPALSCRHYAAAGEHAAVVALNVCMDPRRQDSGEPATATAGSANSLVFHVHGDTVGWADCEAQCHLLRCIAGPLPLREVRLDPAWLNCNDGTVRRLAEAIYEDRHLPEGALDNGRLAILADALEEAGCDNEEILGHLRQQGQVHVRGCWVVDLLMQRA